MALEIERKYLVINPPQNIVNYTSNIISQGYLITTNNIEIRLRKKGTKYYQTIKTGEGLARGETEIEITDVQFQNLWPLTEGKRVEKTRYEIEYEDFLIELDIYSGDLEGLYTAEVEFTSEENSKKFKPPTWFEKEITDDKRYKNKNLALSGIPSA